MFAIVEKSDNRSASGDKGGFYEMKLRTRGISGTRNQAESERERAHRVIARKAAAEGIVLLETTVFCR